MHNWILIFLLLGTSAQAADLRYVFKGAQSASIASLGQVKQMTFGLSQQQVNAIAALTNGEVNFGDVYYLDREPLMLPLASRHPDFSGVIYPNVPPPVNEGQNTEGDPSLRNQWWIDKLGVKNAWSMATGRGVVIADCDAGYYHDESDLHRNMILNARYDLADHDQPRIVKDGPYAFHGTAVAAIMAGVLDNLGTNGIAYNSSVIPLQNYNYDAQLDDIDKEEATAQCVLKAIAMREVDIIVLENQTQNGSSETFVGTRDAVRLAVRAGMIVVSAAGNASVELTDERKDDTGSIIVGALDKTARSAPFSNYGERVTVGAFGEQLYTLYGPGGRFGDFGGTSGATPQVAATVALMKEVHPYLTPELARQILRDTRRMNESNRSVGGLVSVPGAVRAAKDRAAEGAASGWTQHWLFRAQLVAILNRP